MSASFNDSRTGESPPQKDVTPLPDGVGVKSNTKSPHPTQQRPMTRAYREWRSCQLLAAICGFAEARDIFVRLGIPPAIFETHDEQVVAKWALSGEVEPPEHVYDAMMREDESTYSLFESIKLQQRIRNTPRRAVFDVKRHAAYFARRWLPSVLRWAADQIERGDMAFTHAVEHLQMLLNMLAPHSHRGTEGGVG